MCNQHFKHGSSKMQCDVVAEFGKNGKQNLVILERNSHDRKIKTIYCTMYYCYKQLLSFEQAEVLFSKMSKITKRLCEATTEKSKRRILRVFVGTKFSESRKPRKGR